ncbi:MAG: iron ABC transporter permease [Tannerella sp.]|jgi:iron complex transport system permease protein|nr:iron ABC transporter permease [Tannerella sp.]
MNWISAYNRMKGRMRPAGGALLGGWGGGVVLLLLLTVICLYSFTVGRYAISVTDLLHYLCTGECADGNLPIVLFQVRMPRILGAMLAGGALSVSGAAYQGLFRNPMVSPDMLGVSSGAGFGAALAILFSMNMTGIQVMAFSCGLLAVCLALFACRMVSGHDRMLRLVLSGLITGSLFGALISLVKYLADSESKLPDITFWLMGSLSEVSMRELKAVAPAVLLALIPLLLSSWKLNVLACGEEEARTLGVNTRHLQMTVIGCASLLTASVVSVTGLIGWVGLIIPHLARFLVGPDNRLLLPASFLIGAPFLLLVDDLSRSLSSQEIPLGILTSLIGAPVFFGLLRVSSKQAR